MQNTLFSLLKAEGSKGRATRFAAGAGLILGLVGAGGGGFAAATTHAKVIVDGEEVKVRSFGSTVEELLAAGKIDHGDRDLVSPEPSATVRDNDEITVRHARLLTVTIDGKKQELWTTALSLDEALDQLKIRTDDAKLSVSRSTPLGREGLEVNISTPKNINLVIAGQTKNLNTTAATVGDVLAENGVTPTELDRTSPSLKEPVVAGMTIDFSKVEVKEETLDEDVDFAVKEIPNAEMIKGERNVLVEGEKGRATRTYKVTYVNGQVEKREKLNENVTKAPKGAEVEVGTKVPPAVAADSVWDKLAECEAGGNWQANTGNGYYGGLQFSASSWRAVGGTGLPHQASREEQIQMGEKLKAKQGWGAWPACSRKLGLR